MIKTETVVTKFCDKCDEKITFAIDTAITFWCGDHPGETADLCSKCFWEMVEGLGFVRWFGADRSKLRKGMKWSKFNEAS